MPQHIVMTVAGTGSDMMNTASPQPALVGSLLQHYDPQSYLWQPVGYYPAATFPMGPSVQDGVNSLIQLTTGVPTGIATSGPSYPNNSFILLGYSQGALVVCQFIQWCYANSRMDILERLVAVGVWGNPQRMPGFASGNEFAGWPLPADRDGVVTGGIAGPALNMTAEQMQPRLKTPVTHFWGDFVNTNCPDLGATELYANAPVGDGSAEAPAGVVETSIFNAVQNFTFESAFAVLDDLTMPIGLAEAILNGFEFLGAGGNADHYTYDIAPVYQFIYLAGSQTPPFTV